MLRRTFLIFFLFILFYDLVSFFFFAVFLAGDLRLTC